ncbi:hypothetical protein HOLleu_15021 [Holothuria leucospilota]|uniref:Uncharacterized protein n=1 Tax=Holothuria leucospilota TaxID=206669 RepID=A0A9Q1C8G8_HOLLE|nr:hypothetical protein HOLleu_15021 [Holothuria leucospilota]
MDRAIIYCTNKLCVNCRHRIRTRVGLPIWLPARYSLVCKSLDLLKWLGIEKLCEKLVIFSKECKLRSNSSNRMEDCDIVLPFILIFCLKCCRFIVKLGKW